MLFRYQSLIVQVFAHAADERDSDRAATPSTARRPRKRRQTDEEKTGQIATGFRVRPGRVVTSAHVLGSDKPYPQVEVRFPGAGVDGWVSAKVVWNGKEHGARLDIAVLEIAEESVPEAGRPSAGLVQVPIDSRPSHRADWDSRGMVKAGDRLDAANRVCAHVATFGGTICAPDESEGSIGSEASLLRRARGAWSRSS